MKMLDINDSAIFNIFYSVNEVMIGVMFVISLIMLLTGAKEKVPKNCV